MNLRLFVFGMHEIEKSCFKHFFRSIICQMYQSCYRNHIQKYSLQERIEFGPCDLYMIFDGGGQSNTPS